MSEGGAFVLSRRRIYRNKKALHFCGPKRFENSRMAQQEQRRITIEVTDEDIRKLNEFRKEQLAQLRADCVRKVERCVYNYKRKEDIDAKYMDELEQSIAILKSVVARGAEPITIVRADTSI
jgi:hypothetical protein